MESPDREFQPQSVIWAYHTEKVTLSKRLTSGLLYVSENTIQKIELKPIHFSAVATAASTLAIFSLFLPSLIIGSPNQTSAAAQKQKPASAKITKAAAGPTKVNYQGVEMESWQPMALSAMPLGAKAFPRVVQRGGFDSVYVQAANKYGVPWQLLAAVHFVETGQSGDTQAVSSAGALGPMQFMPGTFDRYAQDGDHDGVTSIYDVHDAIFTAAKMLATNGAGNGNARGALYNYNHNNDYVERVLNYAGGLGYSI